MYRVKSFAKFSALAAAALSAVVVGGGCGDGEPAGFDGEPGAALDTVSAEDEAQLTGALSQSAADPASLEGKLLGYVFGDGNYHPHKSPPQNAEFQAPLQVLARDFVLTACKLGYNGRILSKHEPAGKQRIDCSKFTSSTPLTKGSSKYLLTIENFRWPSGGNFKTYAESASLASLKGFMSGLLPVEGTTSGLIDDQFPDSDYTTDAQIDSKLRGVEKILDRLGFKTAQTRRNGSACTSGCRTVNINASQEGCKFNPAYGYTFASYARVPGANSCEGLTCQPPPRCP